MNRKYIQKRQNENQEILMCCMHQLKCIPVNISNSVNSNMTNLCKPIYNFKEIRCNQNKRRHVILKLSHSCKLIKWEISIALQQFNDGISTWMRFDFECFNLTLIEKILAMISENALSVKDLMSVCTSQVLSGIPDKFMIDMVWQFKIKCLGELYTMDLFLS